MVGLARNLALVFDLGAIPLSYWCHLVLYSLTASVDAWLDLSLCVEQPLLEKSFTVPVYVAFVERFKSLR